MGESWSPPVSTATSASGTQPRGTTHRVLESSPSPLQSSTTGSTRSPSARTTTCWRLGVGTTPCVCGTATRAKLLHTLRRTHRRRFRGGVQPGRQPGGFGELGPHGQGLGHENGRCEIVNFDKHTAPVQSVAFSPNGSRVASTGWDGKVLIWDAETGQKKYVVTARRLFHVALPTVSVAFSPNGKRIATGRHGPEDYRLGRLHRQRPFNARRSRGCNPLRPVQPGRQQYSGFRQLGQYGANLGSQRQNRAEGPETQ